jgi:hypothetical protein
LLAVAEVEVADVDLVLAGVAHRAKPPSASKEGRSTTFRRRPGEIGGTRVNQAKRIVTGLVEADSDRVRG